MNEADSKGTGVDITYAKITGILGLLAVLGAFLSNFVPAAIAGQFFSYTMNAEAVLGYYDHPGLIGVFWLTGLVALFVILFAIGMFYSLRHAAKSSGSEVWLGAATVALVAEMIILLVGSGMQWALVIAAGQQAAAVDAVARSSLGVSVQVLFKLYVGTWYIMGDWLEGAWLILFSIAFMKSRAFAGWIAWVGLVTGSLITLKTVTEAFGFPDVLFPSFIGLIVWFVAVSVSLIRLKAQP